MKKKRFKLKKIFLFIAITDTFDDSVQADHWFSYFCFVQSVRVGEVLHFTNMFASDVEVHALILVLKPHVAPKHHHTHIQSLIFFDGFSTFMRA